MGCIIEKVLGMEINMREKVIIKTSIIGIIANVFLVIFKALIGFLSNSIAIILDAVNNLSDALSSIITIIGTKLASKAPDKKHPLGHGRIEYLSAMIIAALVLYAGITSAIESINKIINPEKAEYTAVTIIIISAAVVVKLILGIYVKKQGKKVNSGALVASGTDALFDAVISISVLASAIVFITTGISLEAYVGVIISLVIIKSGIDMMKDTLSEILGKRVDRQIMQDIKATICEEEEVFGAYDLILHDYGPDKYVASVHVEISDTLTARQIDVLARSIADRVYQKHNVLMAGVGIYAVNTTDEEIIELRKKVSAVAMSFDGVLQTHGFYVDDEKKAIFMDVIIDYEIADRKGLVEKINQKLSELKPEYKWNVTLDIDF